MSAIIPEKFDGNERNRTVNRKGIKNCRCNSWFNYYSRSWYWIN